MQAEGPRADAGGRPRVLVVSAVWPHSTGVVQAAEMAAYEITARLAEQAGFDVAYALVSQAAGDPSDAAKRAMAHLKSIGVRFLPPVRLDPFPPKVSAKRYWAGVLAGERRMLLRGWGQAAKLQAALQSLAPWTPDVVIPVWSYEATYCAAGLPAPLLLFHGNPDHKVAEAWHRVAWRWERSWRPDWLLTHALGRIGVRQLERTHLKVLRAFPVIWENAKNDYDYYRERGVQAARYLRNMWPAPGDDECLARRDACEQQAPLKICGNLGHLGATANTFGLWALCDEIVPALRARLGSGRFEVHVYGRTEPRPFLREWLRDTDIKLRGFVDDIEAELMSSPIFLLANNRHDFKVGHTRILTAFATGACVVAFRDTALSMPELVHGENILLGKDGDEIADLVVTAGADRDLRRRIGRNALQTLRDLFSPERAVASMASDARQLLTRRRA
jgi:glycosyltransferase involved in cell wall biosynthesis